MTNDTLKEHENSVEKISATIATFKNMLSELKSLPFDSGHYSFTPPYNYKFSQKTAKEIAGYIELLTWQLDENKIYIEKYKGDNE